MAVSGINSGPTILESNSIRVAAVVLNPCVLKDTLSSIPKKVIQTRRWKIPYRIQQLWSLPSEFFGWYSPCSVH